MTRRTSALAILVFMAGVAPGCIPHTDTQPPPTPSVQAAADEATRLDALADKLYKEGKFANVIPLAERSLALHKKSLGPQHPKLATSLYRLAASYLAQGAYTKAEPLFVRALRIRERTLNPTHPDVAESLQSLGELHWAQGAYTKAEPLLIRALDIREQTLEPLHPSMARSLNSLALLYNAQGAFAKAELLYLRSLALREKALGENHPAVAVILHSLGQLYQTQGALKKAQPLYLRALGIREKALGEMSPDVAQSLDSLGQLYQAQGAFANAEPLFLHALDIHDKTLGPIHPDVAANLSNLAVLYKAQDAFAKAEPLFLRALDIHEKTLGAMHPSVATSLHKLAAFYSAQGAYAKAEPLYLRALDIREQALGVMHPDVAASLHSLAALYWTRGAYAEAEPLVARAAEIREAQLRLELASLSEPRKRALMRLLQRETEDVVSLHADAMPSSQQALDLALVTVLRRKGRVLDSLADNQLSLRAHLTPSVRDMLDELTATSTELSPRLRAPFDPRTAANRVAIAALRARVDDLESALNAASAVFRVQSEPITIAKIQAALPRGAALVEFIRYHHFDAPQANSWQGERYVAYILPWQGVPQAVALGEAAPIDAAVDAVLAAVHRDTSTAAAQAALQHLDTLVFAPLHSRLTNVSHVILSPDGKLNLVPFEALVDPEGHYELEQRLVSYVTSGRDLLRLAIRRDPRSAPTIVAAPDYGPPSAPDRHGLGAFRPLEGATAELAELAAYFVQARTLTGDHATKAALAATVGPAVLHIATHGFYARDAAAMVTSSNRPTGLASAIATPFAIPNPLDAQRSIYVDDDAFPAPSPPSPIEDPTDALDRAGLALAGANKRPDGIVTARELASYDWWGTQLVVLSACETGVGAVPSGEGIYGMRRALALAGVESQVVSLWSANDASTRELMLAFYGELARGTGRAEALRRAKLQLLQQPRFAHPYYWAAFLPAGAWTPLAPGVLKRQEHADEHP